MIVSRIVNERLNGRSSEIGEFHGSNSDIPSELRDVRIPLFILQDVNLTLNSENENEQAASN